MPTDRSNSNSARPLKPTLATTRTAKTPVAPRLAASATTPAHASQPPSRPRSNVSSAPKAAVSSREDLTPVKPFLDNVTPRSSSRKSRASANSTPSGTPSGTPSNSRPTSTVDYPQKEQGYGYGGLGISGANGAQNTKRPRSVVGGKNHNTTPTPRAPLTNIYNQPPDHGSGRDTSPMFFHANAARSQEQVPPPQKRAPVFFYANGQQDESSKPSSVPSPPLSAMGRPQAESRFFYASSPPEARSTPPVASPPPTSAASEPWYNSNPTQNTSSLQPPSPSKEYNHLSYRKGASQIIRPSLHSRPSALSVLSGIGTPEVPQEQSRRSSIASSAVRKSHGKSASLSSIDSVASLKKVPSNDVPSITPSPLHNEKRAVSSGSQPESIASTPAPPTEALSGLPSPSLQSPAVPNGGQSALEKMNELAANARRERKVLDLEISNSSLLAINRQLEREVRKQKAELRRFRRMSRAGRFSTDTASSALNGLSAIDAGDHGDLSDMSEGDEEEERSAEEYDDPSYSSESSLDEGALSPNTLAERDSAHRLGDEKRLQLDLSKHRDLLLDSQKMNQSLKRCLNWTEELIKDGQKALTYQVRVSDVKLGGRVLSSEDAREEGDDPQEDESKTLLSPWTPAQRSSSTGGGGDAFDMAHLTPSERTDRDSGVDLDGLKQQNVDVRPPPLPELNVDFSPLGSPLGEVPNPHAGMNGANDGRMPPRSVNAAYVGGVG